MKARAEGANVVGCSCSGAVEGCSPEHEGVGRKKKVHIEQEISCARVDLSSFSASYDSEGYVSEKRAFRGDTSPSKIKWTQGRMC